MYETTVLVPQRRRIIAGGVLMLVVGLGGLVLNAPGHTVGPVHGSSTAGAQGGDHAR
jgi:hypothetical protein